MHIPPYKVSLLAVYVALLIYVVVQLILVLISKNKKRSFHMAFLILSFLWTGFRVSGSTRMLIPGNDTALVDALVWQTQNWLTIQIQWAMFTFLLLYYFRLLSGHKWSDHRCGSVTVYLVANTVGILVVLLLSAVNTYGASLPSSHTDSGSFNDTQQSFASVCQTLFTAYSSTMFLFLCFGMIVFSVRLCQRKSGHKHHLLNVVQTVVVNILLSMVFMSRAVFDMYNALIKYFTSTHLEIDYPANGLEQDFLFYVVLLLITWEIFPMFVLLITLAKNKAVERRLFSGHLKPGFGVFKRLDSQVSNGSLDARSVDSMEALLSNYDSSPEQLDDDSDYLPHI